MDAAQIQRRLGEAWELHRAGRLADAEGIYREVLAAAPEHASALHFMGILAHQVGRADAAVELFARAIRSQGDVPEFHNNLGSALQALGRVDEAIESYRSAVRLRPDYANALGSLGAALIAAGHSREAIERLREAARLRPEWAQAHNNLGVALQMEERHEEAIDALSRSIAADAKLLEAHYGLGISLRKVGRLDDAARTFRRVLELRADFAPAYNELGEVVRSQNRMPEARELFRRAVELDPSFYAARCNLGAAHWELGEMRPAIAAAREAIALRPDLPEAYDNLANALLSLGQLREAYDARRKALSIRPDFAIGHSNLLQMMHYMPELTAEEIFKEHLEFARRHESRVERVFTRRPRDRKLRVGYVSPDLRQHSVNYFFEPVLAGHDRSEFETVCYADELWSDETTERLRAYPSLWRNITGWPDGRVAERIRDDGIDILVDLAGHTGGNRILVFARKPSPVQVAFLGYLDTTGLSTIDYRITDAHADPVGMTEHLHSEKLIRLPDCAWCYRPAADAPDVRPRWTDGPITFGSFNIMAKMNDSVIALWARVLIQSPGSRLLLKAKAFDDAEVCQRLLSDFAARGVKSDRIELRAKDANPAEHLTRYGEIDIALDPFPHVGATTTCEALWMGVPVITLAGRTHVSRIGVSLLSAIGLPELIANDADGYVRAAAALASDRARLQEIRTGMRQRMRASALMDEAGFITKLENAYRGIGK